MNLQGLFEKIYDLKKITDKIFIYGYGSYGRNLYQILKKNNIFVDGFVLTQKSDEMDSCEIPVYNAEQFFGYKVGYILAMNPKNIQEVKNYLKENNIDDKYIINAEIGKGKRGSNSGSIEITTTIGCKINCKYCPQQLLLARYYEKNPNRTNVMSVETFKKCLDFFPENYDLSFGGMSEPFLNKHFMEMLRIACEKGRKIFLYTTLVGVNKEEIDNILSLPIQQVVLHVADQYGYAHINQNEDYYYILERFINAKKIDGTPFVNMCNAQTDPDEKVKEICKGKYEIFTEMTDRAGNLQNEKLIHNKITTGKISCGNMGNELNNNILLPDGSVVLCCMDFGLKHILGNIYENTYEEIMNGKEISYVREGMNGNTDRDILCRNCSYARKL